MRLREGGGSVKIFKRARKGLLFELQAAINDAKKEKDGVPVRKENIQIERNGELTDVSLEIIAFKIVSNRGRHFLIMFEDSSLAGSGNSAGTVSGDAKLRK